MSELPVPAAAPLELPKPQTLVCANCHAELSGEYCARCGQRHEPHVHTVGHFASEAFESISHADSRLWRTLWYLFARPGFLTREFFAGRRVTYLPPFRLYLVLSVIFFLVTGLPDGSPTEAAVIGRTPAGASGAPAAGNPEIAAAVQDAADAAAANPAGEAGNYAIIEAEGFNEFCDSFHAPETGGAGSSARNNIRRFCERARHDGAAVGAALVHNIPKAMFLFLPLLAGIMKLMYWRPRRYYVEHLLFLVHNHAAVFLAFTLVALIGLIPVVGALSPFLFFAALAYMAWYIYRAMRNVYGQHSATTFLKWFVLGWVYLITGLIMLLLTLIFSAVAG